MKTMETELDSIKQFATVIADLSNVMTILLDNDPHGFVSVEKNSETQEADFDRINAVIYNTAKRIHETAGNLRGSKWTT